jgi:hypothetical protein
MKIKSQNLVLFAIFIILSIFLIRRKSYRLSDVGKTLKNVYTFNTKALKKTK